MVILRYMDFKTLFTQIILALTSTVNLNVDLLFIISYKNNVKYVFLFLKQYCFAQKTPCWSKFH